MMSASNSHRMTAEEINRIADDASNSATWVPAYPDPESDPAVMLTPKQVRDLCDLALKGLCGPAERDALYPIAVRLRTQLAQCIGVLDGQDMTRPEVMAEESRRVMRESYEDLKRLYATEGGGQ